jgi:hypothetical protein
VNSSHELEGFPRAHFLRKRPLRCRRLKDPNALAYHLLLLLIMLDMYPIAFMCTMALAQIETGRRTARYEAALKKHWGQVLKAFFLSLAVLPVGTCLAGLGPFHLFVTPLLAMASWVLCLATAESVNGCIRSVARFHASVSSSVATFRRALHRVKMSMLRALHRALVFVAWLVLALVIVTSFSVPSLPRENPISLGGLVLNSDAAVQVAGCLNLFVFLPFILLCIAAASPVTSVLFVASVALFPSLCSFPSAIFALWACSNVARFLCLTVKSLLALANRAYEWATAAVLAVEEAADRKLQALDDATNTLIWWFQTFLRSAAVSCFWWTLRTLPSVINVALTTHFLTSPSPVSFALALAVKLILAGIKNATTGP